jgi:hypothetical protein
LRVVWFELARAVSRLGKEPLTNSFSLFDDF